MVRNDITEWRKWCFRQLSFFPKGIDCAGGNVGSFLRSVRASGFHGRLRIILKNHQDESRSVSRGNLQKPFIQRLALSEIQYRLPTDSCDCGADDILSLHRDGDFQGFVRDGWFTIVAEICIEPQQPQALPVVLPPPSPLPTATGTQQMRAPVPIRPIRNELCMFCYRRKQPLLPSERK